MTPIDEVQPPATVDVAIVGGRVAGCVLGALLGAAGLRVVIVERDAPGTDTLSTHYMTGEGVVGALARLGVLDEVLALGPPPLRCEYRFYGGAADPVVIPAHSPGAVGYALSVRRGPLDAILQRRVAATPRVALRTRTRATGLMWDGERVAGVTIEGPSGPATVPARLVVGADGRHSSVARWVAATAIEEHPSARALVYRYVAGFRGFDGRLPDGSEFSLLDDEALYGFPSDGDATCLALSIPIAQFRAARGRLEALFDERVAAHRGLAERVRAARPVDGGRLRGTGGLPDWVRRPAGPGWALVGDAGLHLDPWTGRGMDFAAIHAGLLAEAIVAWMRDGADEAGALETHARRRDEQALATFRFTVDGARDLRPLAREDAWDIIPLPAPPPPRWPVPTQGR